MSNINIIIINSFGIYLLFWLCFLFNTNFEIYTKRDKIIYWTFNISICILQTVLFCAFFYIK